MMSTKSDLQRILTFIQANFTSIFFAYVVQKNSRKSEALCNLS